MWHDGILRLWPKDAQGDEDGLETYERKSGVAATRERNQFASNEVTR